MSGHPVSRPHRSLKPFNRSDEAIRIRCRRIFTALVLAVLSFAAAWGQPHSVTYRENSDHELTIYFINGKEPGKTMMIIGGIQGDEPGGYLTADLYADMLLEKGNLIVVPRANFNSIIQNQRGVNGDMNRKFSQNTLFSDDDDLNIVNTLKELIKQSDVLLNLHEGSGFYSPDYISDMLNPLQYGQSIIADAALYRRPDSTVIDLEGTAKRVIESVNRNIKNGDHIFRFNNHNTLSEKTLHLEQRKSATFYALTKAGIPSFGVETSKDIKDIVTKVKYQTLVINAFMAEYGIIPEHPSVFLPVPELDHLVINVSGVPTPFAVKNGETLDIPAGSTIHVSSVVANYKRGLSIDIVDMGNSNDIDRVVVINSPTTIEVYKDAYLCGKVRINTIEQAGLTETERLKQLEIAVGAKKFVVSESDTLHIVKGDGITVVNAWMTNGTRSGFRINFVGFVGNKKFNDAEDRGYPINTARDLMQRFSVGEKGLLYLIDAENIRTNENIGTVYVALDGADVDYLIMERADGTKLALPPGSVLRCKKQDRIKVLSIISNITEEPFVDAYIQNGTDRWEKLVLPADLVLTIEMEIQFRRESHYLGSISLRIDG